MGLTKFEMQPVHRVPEELLPGSLYVCFDCNVVVHLCACGCGRKVVLPISPDFWTVSYYDGENISLAPSIGNFQFPCKSHYWIRNNHVVWADSYSETLNVQKKKRSFLNRIKGVFNRRP